MYRYSISSRALIERYYTCEKFGADFKEFLTFCNIQEHNLLNPYYEHSIESEDLLWNYVFMISGIRHFGLLYVSEFLHRIKYSLLESIKEKHKTVGNAIIDLSNLNQVLGWSTFHQSTLNTLAWEINIELQDEDFPMMFNSADAHLLLLSQSINFLVGRYIKPKCIYLKYPKPEYSTIHYHCWGDTPIVYKAREYKILYECDHFQLPLEDINSSLEKPMGVYLSHHRLFEMIKQNDNAVKSYKNRVLVILQSFNPEKNIQLIDVARKMHLSERSLQLKLKEENTTFSDLLAEFKIDKAKNFLIEKDDTITSIAFSLGYSDVSGFSRLFKKLTGYSPGKFRKQALLK